MPNKRKCRNRECNTFFKPDPARDIYTKVFWCSNECRAAIAIAHYRKGQENKLKARDKAEKRQKQQWKKDRAEYNREDVRVRKPATKRACHEYVRYRDRNDLCICCKKPLGDDYHAGHWLESNNNPQVRYDERNIHAQRLDCNHFKGGDSGDYEKNLRAKIGDDEVDNLLTMKGGTMKRTADDYREIEAHFRAKLKQLTEGI